MNTDLTQAYNQGYDDGLKSLRHSLYSINFNAICEYLKGYEMGMQAADKLRLTTLLEAFTL